MVEKSIKLKRKATKNNLKTMSKTTKAHRLRTARRIAKYGTISFTRNVWLSIAATLVMTITLIILSVTVAASVVLSHTAESMRDKIDITVFFRPNTSQRKLDEMAEIMRKDKNVKSVVVADSKTEYERFVKENAEDKEILNAINDKSMEKILLDSMQATMRIKAVDTNNLDSIKSIVETNAVFERYLDEDKAPTYDANHTEIETITSWTNVAKNGGITLSVVFLVISILVIFNTVRMAIFSRREEIYMMKLIGANTNFIRGPFLIEAEMCGVISGMVASAVCYFGFSFLAPKLASYDINVGTIMDLINSQWLVVAFGVLILVGMTIGFFSARLAIRKYLHKF